MSSYNFECWLFGRTKHGSVESHSENTYLKKGSILGHVLSSQRMGLPMRSSSSSRRIKTNLAKTGVIFPKNHPYYNGVPRKVLEKAIAYLSPESTFMDIVLGDHEIKIHPLHGRELGKNIDASNVLLKHDTEAN